MKSHYLREAVHLNLETRKTIIRQWLHLAIGAALKSRRISRLLEEHSLNAVEGSDSLGDGLRHLARKVNCCHMCSSPRLQNLQLVLLSKIDLHSLYARQDTAASSFLRNDCVSN